MGDVFYWGKRGGTKTCRAVMDVWLDYVLGYEVWTNTWLHPAFDINYKTRKKGNLHIVDAVDLIKLLLNDDIPETETPKVLLLDEIKTQANAKEFMSFINTHLTNFVSQARKRGFKLIYTDQILGAYDRWIRLMTDKVVRCVPVFNHQDLGFGDMEYPEPVKATYYEVSLNEDNLDDEPVSYELSRTTLRNFYPLYRTRKIVTPVSLKYSQEVKEMQQNAV